MPFGDPAGYLPRVKRARKRGKSKSPLVAEKSHSPKPRPAGKTGGAQAPAKLAPASPFAAQQRLLRKSLDELRKRRNM